MYTYEEALKLAKYYKDKVIGKDLGEKGVGLKIHSVEVDKTQTGTFNVFCYAYASPSVIMHNRIQLVVEHLGLPDPDSVLKEINQNDTSV